MLDTRTNKECFVRNKLIVNSQNADKIKRYYSFDIYCKNKRWYFLNKNRHISDVKHIKYDIIKAESIDILSDDQTFINNVSNSQKTYEDRGNDTKAGTGNRMPVDKWFSDKEILNLSNKSNLLKKRYVFSDLIYYLTKENTNYICALYGLRRTGKTTLMFQAIDYLISHKVAISDIAYITFSKNTLYSDEQLINELEGIDKKYIFIDEISFLKINDLEENHLNILSDKFAMKGIKIVITGTFSYAIKLLENDVLFDRMEKIDTTYFSFKEAHDIFGYDIEKFIEYGGIIKTKEKDSYTHDEYMQTAILSNISSALIKSEKIYDIFPDYADDNKKQVQKKIENLIKRLIDQYMKQIVYGKVVRSNYKYNDIGILLKKISDKSLYDSIIMEIGEYISFDRTKYTKLIEDTWDTLSKNDLSIDTFYELLNILKSLNVICDVKFLKQTCSVFTSHYLRYELCNRIVNIISDEIRKDTNNRYSAKIANDIVKGDILEAITHLDIYKTNKYIFDKYRNSEQWEVDLIIDEGKFIDIYEVKHSALDLEEHAKNLLNLDFLQEIEQFYDKPIRKKVVLYRGENKVNTISPTETFKSIIEQKQSLGKTGDRWVEINEKAIMQKWINQDIEYKNIEEFLLSL